MQKARTRCARRGCPRPSDARAGAVGRPDADAEAYDLKSKEFGIPIPQDSSLEGRAIEHYLDDSERLQSSLGAPLLLDAARPSLFRSGLLEWCVWMSWA